MQEVVVSVILLVVGLINFVPVAGVVSSKAVSRAYGIHEPSGDLALLLRHRAALFGLVGGFIMISAFYQPLQLAAVIMAYASMLSFVVLASLVGPVSASLVRVRNIDVVAIVLLSIVPAMWAFRGLAA